MAGRSVFPCPYRIKDVADTLNIRTESARRMINETKTVVKLGQHGTRAKRPYISPRSLEQQLKAMTEGLRA